MLTDKHQAHVEYLLEEQRWGPLRRRVGGVAAGSWWRVGWASHSKPRCTRMGQGSMVDNMRMHVFSTDRRGSVNIRRWQQAPFTHRSQLQTSFVDMFHSP